MSKPVVELTNAELADEARTAALMSENVAEILVEMADRLSPNDGKQHGIPTTQKFGDDPADTEAMRGALEGDDAK